MNTATDSLETNSPKSGGGVTMGQSSSDLIGFYGATPIAQRADASQVAITDSSAGTVSDAIAAGVGKYVIPINLPLVGITGNVDVITEMVIPHKFKVLAVDFFVSKIASTAGKAATLNLEINTTNVTGGSVALTTANCGTLGAKVAGSAITAANTGAANDVLSIEAASVTAFAEGDGVLLIHIQNMDVADAWASISDKWNEVRTALVNLGLISGAA